MPQFKTPLKRKEVVAEDTMAFWFDISDKELDFKPGQFGNFMLENPKYEDDKGSMRSFSIASSPNNEEEMLIATRMRDSGFKKSLREMEAGDEINFMGPMGAFTLHTKSKLPAVFHAGGIGITPFLSMIKYATEESLDNEMYLFYSNRTPESTAFLNELEELAESNENFKLIPTITDSETEDWDYEYGRITPEMVREYVEDAERAIHYIVGPPGMVSGMRDSLTEAGFDEGKIETENFTGY